MKHIFSILALMCAITLASCNDKQPCEIPTNGFLTDTEFQVKMGSSSAVDIFNQLDTAWAKRDY